MLHTPKFGYTKILNSNCFKLFAKTLIEISVLSNELNMVERYAAN